MRFTVTFALLLSTAAFADTLSLRSGQVVNGTYLGGTSRTIKMEVGDAIQTYDVSDIVSLQFTAPAPAASAPAPAAAAPPPDNPPAPAPDNAPAPPQDNAALGIEIPAGTEFTVRMIDSVDSETNSVGQTFQASMDEPVIINGETIVPRGADVIVKLVDNKESGKLTGTTQLALNLASVRLNGNMININTQSV